MGTLKTLFASELRKAKSLVKRIYTGKRSLNELPNALQHFLLQSGFTTLENIHQVKIEWAATKLKLSTKSDWKTINCVQHNFLPDPIRLVYMSTKWLGVFALEAFDSFRHGRGSMIIKLAKLFNLVNITGYRMDKAELVTILAETMIIPDYALQGYISWEEINPYTLSGTINYHGLKASGIFYFNHNFELIKFETYDRYFTDGKGNLHQTKWTAECSNYLTHGAIRFPANFKATWNFSTGDFTYFEGEIKNIIINPLRNG